MQLTCPSEDRLRDFLAGTVSDAEVDAISDHVDGCSSCDLAISKLEDQQADVVEELREGLRIEELLNEPELQRLCKTVEFPFAKTAPLSNEDQNVGSGKRLRDYRLVKKIGEGGMGTVYQAVHVHLGKSVALKILPADKLRSRIAVDRFRQEMRAVGRVNHTNVVSASDAGTVDGQHFLVMELVEGADLARIIMDQGALEIADACEIVRQAAIGLQHAHDTGLVHRDVKPSNLMLAIDGTVKVLDLGLAGLSNTEFESTGSVVVTDRLTSVGQIMGTLDYMAPEQITSSMHVDGRADIYALGATLFQLLTKRTPCGDRSADTPERIEAVLHKPPLEIASLRDNLPKELRVLLRKMLEKTPQSRPQTAQDVAGELSRFTNHADLVALAEECRTSLDIPSADVDVTDDVSFLVTRRAPDAYSPPNAHLASQGRFLGRRFFTAVVLATLFVATMFVATVFYIQTDNGIVRVEVKDDSLAVNFSAQNIRSDDGNKEFTVTAGEQNRIVINQDGSNVQFETESFQIRRNDKIVFEVELLDGDVVVSKNGMPFHREKATPSTQSEVSERDLAKLLASDLGGLKEAENAVAKGDFAKAREILRTVPNTGSFEDSNASKAVASDSDAAVAFKLAELLEGRGDFHRAAEAYLEAYRLVPRMLDDDHLPLIKRAGLTSEFVEVFTEVNVKKMPEYSYVAGNIVRDLLKDEATRTEGNRLLKRVWSKPGYQNSLLTLRPEEVWSYVPDPGYYLRSKLIPSDIASEGSGWARFKIEGVYEFSEEPGWGFPLSLRPLLSDKAVLRKMALEVQAAIGRNPDWKAGPAVLSYLEAEVGNYQRATDLMKRVLKDAETRAIPSDSAFVFGMAMEGKNADLDRQVMRLYESSLQNRPGRVFRASAIPKLGRLYAKYDRHPESQQVLYRLTNVDYAPKESLAICSPGRRPSNQSRCTACHSGKSNLLDIVVMSNGLTDVGYPVDAMLSLARIDASFGNAYGSDDAWAQMTIPADFYSDLGRGKQHFATAKAKAKKAIGPQAVLRALKSGACSGRDMTKPATANSDSSIVLMLSVRGEDGKSTVFSPVIDVLKLAVESKSSGAAEAIAEVDQRLQRLSEANPQDVQTMVAATAFAFLRNDLNIAEKRLKELLDLRSTADGKPKLDNVNLWIVARQALQYESTRIVGAILAERALAAAGTQPNSIVKEAILRERSGIRTK